MEGIKLRKGKWDLLYKCRACGAVYRDEFVVRHEIQMELVLMGMDEMFIDGAVLPTLHHHYCGDYTLGISDLVGFSHTLDDPERKVERDDNS